MDEEIRRLEIPGWPKVDFAAFGDVEIHKRSRIQRVVSGFMSRNWTMIPHVTHHGEADVTLLEQARKGLREAGSKVTALPFFVKAVVSALQQHPQFNASLTADGDLVLKRYFHIGIAVDSPNGLLVPVIRDCDQKTVAEIGEEIDRLALKARGRGLPLADMIGGCFTISSLGGIGSGTAFTPIINAPELAILGITKSDWKPRRGVDDGIDWRLTAPLDLSYDHRVLNGAEAAKFMASVIAALGDPASLLSLPDDSGDTHTARQK